MTKPFPINVPDVDLNALINLLSDQANDIADLKTRVHALEAEKRPCNIKTPPGMVPLKAVDQFGFQPEYIRRKAVKGKIGARQVYGRWFISETDLIALSRD
jgi:hypothetical protein